MPVIEIPRSKWSQFFDSFSLRHQGWLVSLEIKNDGLLDRLEVIELPLEGISVDDKANKADKANRNIISISVGREGQSRLRHAVTDPTTVRLEQTADLYDEAIEIDAHSREKTDLLVHAPMTSDALS